MSKYLFAAFLLCFCCQLSWAQLSEEELRLEFDRIEEQMAEALEQLQQTVENGQLFQIDTTIIRTFPFDGAEEPGFHPQGDPLQLQQLLDQFMGQLTEEDWAAIQRLFDDFQQGFAIPEDDSSAPNAGETKPPKPSKRKKNSKIYSL